MPELSLKQTLPRPNPQLRIQRVASPQRKPLHSDYFQNSNIKQLTDNLKQKYNFREKNHLSSSTQRSGRINESQLSKFSNQNKLCNSRPLSTRRWRERSAEKKVESELFREIRGEVKDLLQQIQQREH